MNNIRLISYLKKASFISIVFLLFASGAGFTEDEAPGDLSVIPTDGGAYIFVDSLPSSDAAGFNLYRASVSDGSGFSSPRPPATATDFS